MNCSLAQFEAWSDAWMGIYGIERVGWESTGRGEKGAQWNKNKMNSLLWNIIPGYIYNRPDNDTVFAWYYV